MKFIITLVVLCLSASVMADCRMKLNLVDTLQEYEDSKEIELEYIINPIITEAQKKGITLVEDETATSQLNISYKMLTSTPIQSRTKRMMVENGTGSVVAFVSEIGNTLNIYSGSKEEIYASKYININGIYVDKILMKTIKKALKNISCLQ